MSLTAFLIFLIPVLADDNILLRPGDGSRVVDDYFLVTLRRNIPPISAYEQFMEDVPHIELKQLFVIGELTIILARSDHRGLQALLRSNVVDAIEPEQMMMAPASNFQPIIETLAKRKSKRRVTRSRNGDEIPDNCYLDPIGKFGWGLIRSGFAKLPNFDLMPYYPYGLDDGSEVDIYVLDTGVKVEHSEFQGRAVHGMTAVNVSGEGDADLSGHGTFVAGVAAGDLFGMAKRANIISVKVLDRDRSGPTSSVIEGLEWAVNDIVRKRRAHSARRSVINMSLGGTGPLYTVESIIQAVIDMNIHIVTSAGNGYVDACSVSPARISSIITVGATTNRDGFAKTSNYGPCVDVLAPGEGIGGPHVRVPYALESGTSVAAPHVTGVIARHLSAMSDEEVTEMTPSSMKTLILDSALKGYINFLGYPWLMSTPNRLLQKSCSPLPVPTVPVPETTSTSSATTPGLTTATSSSTRPGSSSSGKSTTSEYAFETSKDDSETTATSTMSTISSATTTPTPSTPRSATATPTPPTTSSATATPTPSNPSSATATPTLPTPSSATATPTPSTPSSATATPTPSTSSSATATPTPSTPSSATATPTPSTSWFATATPTPSTPGSATATPTPSTPSSATATPTPSTPSSATATPTPSTPSSATATPSSTTTTRSSGSATTNTSTQSTSTASPTELPSSLPIIASSSAPALAVTGPASTPESTPTDNLPPASSSASGLTTPSASSSSSDPNGDNVASSSLSVKIIRQITLLKFVLLYTVLLILSPT